MLQKELKETEDEYLEALSYSKRILQQANLINVKLDGKLFTYLPHFKGVSSSYILKKLQNRLPNLVNEFAVVQNTNMGKTIKIKNLTRALSSQQEGACIKHCLQCAHCDTA